MAGWDAPHDDGTVPPSACADSTVSAGAIAAALGERAEEVCERYLPLGRRSGRYWTVGDLQGMSGHARYAPCTLSDLTTKGYDYWALGHVHQTQVLHEHPHVVFPGNLQGRHVRETGPKGACLVTVHEGEVTALDTVPLDVVRLSRVRVRVEDTADLACLASRTRSALESTVSAEADGLVTSANFTAAAQERNIELGILLDSTSVAEQIERHFLALIEGEDLERLPLQPQRA